MARRKPRLFFASLAPTPALELEGCTLIRRCSESVQSDGQQSNCGNGRRSSPGAIDKPKVTEALRLRGRVSRRPASIAAHAAGHALGRHRSTQRKIPTAPDDEAPLTADIVAVAIQDGRDRYQCITAMTPPTDFDALAARLRGCRICRDAPRTGRPLPHEPRPILQGSAGARLCIASQAPGARAHATGTPFSDPSGVRLRAWLDLDAATFYDASRVAIVPMGSCFPGHDAKGGDLPPRPECAEEWRDRLFTAMPELDLILVIGQYAQSWHLGDAFHGGLTGTVKRWREIWSRGRSPRVLPLPHPSWRNNGWLRANPWFEAELLPVLRAEVRSILALDRKDPSA